MKYWLTFVLGECVCVLVGVSVCACEDSCVRHKPGSNDEEKARSEKIHQTRFKA